MKFDYIIGNPPYQDNTLGENDTFAPPVYHRFLDEAFKIGQGVELIHPARFLFNAGSTPKKWNRKMLNDPHLKVLQYVADESTIFPNTSINGGVAITYHDTDKEYGPIEVFAQFEELNSIRRKVCDSNFESLEDTVFSAYSYHLSNDFYSYNPELTGRLSEGHDFDLKSNILELMPEVFKTKKESDDDIRILGRIEGQRAFRWVSRKLISSTPNLDKYKVIVAGADGAAGTVGKPIPARVVGLPTVVENGVGTTESFVSIGAFSTLEHAENAMRYIKTKFARTMLGILKVTQAVTPGKWHFVPAQDFTENSDIDWSRSLSEIDQQLYRKYNLSQREIDFIETHVKEME